MSATNPSVDVRSAIEANALEAPAPDVAPAPAPGGIPHQSDLWRTAVHEAGHAVQLWTVWNEMPPGYTSPWASIAVFGQPQFQKGLQMAGCVEFDGALIRSVVRRTGPVNSQSMVGTVAAASVYAAGVVAEAMLRDEDPSGLGEALFGGGGEHDWEAICKLASPVCMEDTALAERAVTQAHVSLKRSWPLVLRLAATVLRTRSRTLSWAEAVEAATELASDRPPLLVTRHAATWCLAPSGDYVLVRDPSHAIAKWHPTVDPTDAKHMIRSCGRRADSVVYDLVTGRRGYRRGKDEGGTLYLPCARMVEVDPLPDERVAKWLELLAGDQHGRVLDWLATCHRLDRPTSAVYLCGAKGAGKQLFAAGVASIWGSAPCDYRDIAGTTFNSSLRESPVVFLDESSSGTPARGASWMSLVANVEHVISEKFVSTATLLGSPRLVVGANDWGALPVPREATEARADAIGERILAVKIPCRVVDGSQVAFAAEYLHQLEGWLGTEDWIKGSDGGPGRFVRHVAWLRQTRAVAVGARWLVAGDAGLWRTLTATVEGSVGERALHRIVASLMASERGVVVKMTSDNLLISPEGLHRSWSTAHSGPRPTMTALGSALRILAGHRRGSRPPRVLQAPCWPVPIAEVARVAVDQHRVPEGEDAKKLIMQRARAVV